jgi:hypothetical protein
MLWIEDRRYLEALEEYYARGIVATGYIYPVAQSYMLYNANQETINKKIVYYNFV